MLNRKATKMNLKSFFNLKKVIFSKENLEAPYENKSPQKEEKNNEL